MTPTRLITTGQMRAIDAACVALGVPIRTLMENAGAAAAREALAHFPGARFDVLCGPGDNGGDGFVAARLLRQAGADVQALALNPGQTGGASGLARADWAGAVAQAAPDQLRADAVIIDALFGAGLSRPLDGAAAALAQASQARHVVSVDTPSGLPGDGAAPDGACFRADLTVTFGFKKPAHVLIPGRQLCGKVIVADIGAPVAAAAGLDVYAEENAPSLWRLPTPSFTAHKHARGRVLVRADGRSVSAAYGAQRLAAGGAQRIGAGWVCVSLADPAAAGLFSTPMALLVQPIDEVEIAAFDACVIGAGLRPGPDLRASLMAAAGAGAPLVIDGGGLSVLADGALALPVGSVLTPHAGEFARLAPDLSAGSKIERAKAAAQRFNAIVVFKGADTVIAAPDGRARVNTHATPYLASAGTGDVLAGMIAGLIAQAMEPLAAACAAVWLHGAAGLACGPGLIADDLLAALPATLADQALADQALA